MSVVLDPNSREFIVDPYPIFHRLRAEDPVHFSERLGGWVLTRYDDVRNALHDPRLSSVRRNQAAHLRGMNYTDPPDHTRLRGLVSKAFTPRAVERMRARVQQIVADLIAKMERGRPVDLIEALAYPLPITVIAEMVGVPTEDNARFKAWSDALVAVEFTSPDKASIWESAVEFAHYLADLVEKRRSSPQPDLLSSLIAAEERGDLLSETELIANVILLIAAGNETTTNLIGNSVLAMLRHPDLFARLAADPSLMAPAIEEFLRYDTPVLVQGRIARETVEIGSKVISTGQRVYCAIAAANRDPSVFADPDRIEIGRPNQHLAFGFGIHYCLGAPLARLETEIGLRSLLERAPQLRLAAPPLEHAPSLVFRGVRTLPVLLD